MVDKERLPRPDSKDFLDLEKREPFLPRGYIKSYMMSGHGYSVEYGKYGVGRYGRCKYGARVGIYGYDYYGSCVYH